MTVRKLKGYWSVDLRFEGKRRRLKCPENSKAGARAFLKLLQKKLARGEPLSPAPEVKIQTFAEFSQEWFKTYVIPNNKPSEQRGKESILTNNLLPVFGKIPLDQIGTQSIEEYKALYLKQGLSRKTVNNHLAVLGKCLRSAFEWEKIDRVPKIKKLSFVSSRIKFYTIDQSTRLIKAAEDRLEWHVMILLALRTGMRLGELFGLKWQDINFEQSVITICRSIVEGIESSPKTHRERTIAFPESVRHAFKTIGPKEGLVFHRTDGRPLSHGIAEFALKRACKKADLPYYGWHALRHTCASQLAQVRNNSIEAQRMLGHTSITMTERYTHIVPSFLHDAVAALDTASNNIKFGHQMGTT